MALPESIEAGIVALAEDNISGATDVTKHAAAVVLQLCDPKLESSESELRDHLEEFARACRRAQPAMAPMLNLADRILRCLKDPEPGLRDRVKVATTTFASQLDTSASRIALHAREVLSGQQRMLTHSNSSVVKKTLLTLHQRGWAGSVICTESRPMNEGVELARELAGHGMAVTLLTDAAAFQALAAVSGVLLGADSISTGGIVNKIGSSGIALAASLRSLPVYVLCGTEKFIPKEMVVVEERKASELLSEEITNLSVSNIYFDVTPLESIAGVVTEEGLLTPEEVKSQLTTIEQGFVLKP